MNKISQNTIIFSFGESSEKPIIFDAVFDNGGYFEFVERSREDGITAPIYAGVIPIVSVSQIGEISRNNAVGLPKKYVKMIEKFGDKPDVFREAGIAFAVSQIVELLSANADGICLYTLDDADLTDKICGSISGLFLPNKC